MFIKQGAFLAFILYPFFGWVNYSIFGSQFNLVMEHKHIFIPFFVCCIVALSSCGDGSSDDQIETTQESVVVEKDTTAVTVDDEKKFKFDFALANIPSPVSMMNEVSKWGEPYNSDLFNDTKKMGTYSREFSKAVNLGIYNMDLSYAMVNDKGADVLKYMRTVLVLSDALGLKGAVDQMVGKRAEKNLGNKDSLMKILDEIFVKSDYYLRTNERVFTAASVFAGSWIESFYLTDKIAEMSSNQEVKKKARMHLWEQRFHLGNLIAVLEEYKNKKEAVELNNEFKAIHADLKAIKDPKDMNDEKFKAISEKLLRLRTSFTN